MKIILIWGMNCGLGYFFIGFYFGWPRVVARPLIEMERAEDVFYRGLVVSPLGIQIPMTCR